MTTDSLVDRLAEHRTLGSAPREQLEWIVARGTLRHFEPGEVLGTKGTAPTGLFIVLSGHIAIRVDLRGGGSRKAMEWQTGDVAGQLPYSRLVAAPGTSTAEEPTEVLELPTRHFPEMIRECQDVTARCVHVMLDRARRFTSVDLHDEKMVSLGRLSAGLAHELNNPASAVARSAKGLLGGLIELDASALALGAAGLSAEQLATLERVRKECEKPGASTLTPMERADREDALDAWLGAHRQSRGILESLLDAPLTIADLDRLAEALGDDLLGYALRSIGAIHRVRRLVVEVETAANRVHDLVAAVKGFTHMDQSGIRKPVDIRQGLKDTLVMLGSKAREKSVSVTIHAPDDLPMIEGFGGELNQVWANLIGNAIDAVAEGGWVQVKAAPKEQGVVVCVVDNGPGVPEDLKDRIFEPFFTTKPQGQGTGLGLDFVRRLVRLHDGEIELTSVPGRTEFRVILPGT